MAVSKVLSIEITDKITRVCFESYNKKTTTVFKSISFTNPEGTVDDGFVTDRGVYGSFLKEQLALEKLKCKDVVFVISSAKIMTREAVIADMKPENIVPFITENREEYFPMDTSDFVFTYNLLEKNKAEKTMRIMIYAAPDILLKNYVALSGELELKLRALDYSGNAIYQWQKSKHHEPIDLYLQINENNSMLTILENGTLAMQRNMAFGIASLATPLIESGYYDDLDFNGAVERLTEKELLYSSYDNMAAFYPENDGENKLHNVKTTLNNSVRPLIENLTRVLEYYNSKHRDAQVEKIYVGGVGARVKNLRKLLASEFLGIDFVKVLELPGVKISKKNPLNPLQGSEYTACVGAGVQTVNFYDDKNKNKIGVTLVLSILGLVAVIGASLMIVQNGWTQYDAAVKERNKLKKQQDELEAQNIEALEAKANAAASEAQGVADFDASTFRYNEMFNEVLGALETYSVQDMLVSSLTSSQDSGLMLSITVNSKEEAAKLIEQLRYIPYFEDVHVYNVTQTEDTDTNTIKVSFTAQCIYKVPEEEVQEEGGAQQ
jgi:Tfp pilus assembly PilM family ATPase